MATADTAPVPSSTEPPSTINRDAYISTVKDQEILSTPEHLFKAHTWAELTRIVHENRLEDLKRRPGDLRRYLEWGHETRKKYGSIQRFLLEKRLFWDGEGGLEAKSSVPFECEEDTKILINDWPYALEPGVTHVVVWTKAGIPVDATTGDLTPESRTLIENYVNRMFVERLGLPKQNVLWFKNWAALQSVRTVEHVHVLVSVDNVEIEGEGVEERLRRLAE